MVEGKVVIGEERAGRDASGTIGENLTYIKAPTMMCIVIRPRPPRPAPKGQ